MQTVFHYRDTGILTVFSQMRHHMDLLVFDLNGAGCWLLRLSFGKFQGEHTMLHVPVNLIRIHIFREREGTMYFMVRSFLPNNLSFLLFLLFLLPFRRQGEHTIFHGHLDIIRAHSWNICRDCVVRVIFSDVTPYQLPFSSPGHDSGNVPFHFIKDAGGPACKCWIVPQGERHWILSLDFLVVCSCVLGVLLFAVRLLLLVCGCLGLELAILST
mmetsp:Transcript_1203/g.7900  ORF Transcript_1203/g.7900 Transcript_1203/m.7900 type:complete len:214 (+) Transcript_1203:3117-3758(+)